MISYTCSSFLAVRQNEQASSGVGTSLGYNLTLSWHFIFSEMDPKELKPTCQRLIALGQSVSRHFDHQEFNGTTSQMANVLFEEMKSELNTASVGHKHPHVEEHEPKKMTKQGAGTVVLKGLTLLRGDGLKIYLGS